jgi:hypothetical protein
MFLFSAVYKWPRDCHFFASVLSEGLMLKIQRAATEEVLLTLIGRMTEENVAELKTLFLESKGRRIVLDLKDLTLVDNEAVKYLERCETDGTLLRNCPAYIREWITRQRLET